MRSLQEAQAVPGRGLEGDHYFLGTGYFSRHHGPSYELTLIEVETIDALNEEYDDLQSRQETPVVMSSLVESLSIISSPTGFR